MQNALESFASLDRSGFPVVRSRAAFVSPFGRTAHRRRSYVDDGHRNGGPGGKGKWENFRKGMITWGFDAIQLALLLVMIWWLVFHA